MTDLSVKDLGAIGDGIADETAALSDASGGYFPRGAYKVTSNITFNNPVIMGPGAVLVALDGVTLIFNAGFYAGVYQVFKKCWTAS